MKPPGSSYSDEELIQMLKSQNSQRIELAWREVYREHFSSKKGLARKYRLPEGVYDDLFQDAIIAFRGSIMGGGELQEGGSIGGWLWGILRLRILKWLRDERPRQYQLLDQEDRMLLQEAAPSEIEHRELAEAMMEYILRLNERCQSILILFYYDRWGLDSIADHLKAASGSAAKMAKHRCLTKLREIIRKDGTF